MFVGTVIKRDHHTYIYINRSLVGLLCLATRALPEPSSSSCPNLSRCGTLQPATETALGDREGLYVRDSALVCVCGRKMPRGHCGIRSAHRNPHCGGWWPPRCGEKNPNTVPKVGWAVYIPGPRRDQCCEMGITVATHQAVKRPAGEYPTTE